MKRVKKFGRDESGLFNLNPGAKGLLVCMFIVGGVFSVSAILREILGTIHLT